MLQLIRDFKLSEVWLFFIIRVPGRGISPFFSFFDFRLLVHGTQILVALVDATEALQTHLPDAATVASGASRSTVPSVGTDSGSAADSDGGAEDDVADAGIGASGDGVSVAAQAAASALHSLRAIEIMCRFEKYRVKVCFG